MRKDLIKPVFSSFLSCEKDIETIIRRLFIENKARGKELIKLLVINTKDCLEQGSTSPLYEKIIADTSVRKLFEQGYIRLAPKLALEEHDEVKSYLIISFDNFIENETNPEFRDCTVTFDILCHTDYWDLGDYRLRPLKIAGYIDGLLNKTKLSGIGTFNFLSCNELILNEDFSGYSLMYSAIHGVDDVIPEKSDE